MLGLERGRRVAESAQQRDVTDPTARQVEDDRIGRRVVADLADQLDGCARHAAAASATRDDDPGSGEGAVGEPADGTTR